MKGIRLLIDYLLDKLLPSPWLIEFLSLCRSSFSFPLTRNEHPHSSLHSFSLLSCLIFLYKYTFYFIKKYFVK